MGIFGNIIAIAGFAGVVFGWAFVLHKSYWHVMAVFWGSMSVIGVGALLMKHAGM